MAKPQHSTANENSPDAEKPSAAGDLSSSELRVLHEGLAALRETDETSEEIDTKEHKSVRALIAWTACDLGVNEEVISAQVERHFELSNISELHSGHYDDLVRFLEKMDIKQFIN